jgi:hypothetical protein
MKKLVEYTFDANKISKNVSSIGSGIERKETVLRLNAKPVEYNPEFFEKLKNRQSFPSLLEPNQQSCLAHLSDQLQTPPPVPTSYHLNQLLDHSQSLRDSLPELLDLLNHLPFHA